MKRLYLSLLLLSAGVECVHAFPVFVNITSPGTNNRLEGIATVQASASSFGGAISRVEFKLGNVVIGVDTSSPYTAQLNTTVLSGSVNNYTLRATAYDVNGFSATTTKIILAKNDGFPNPVYNSATAISVADNILLFQRNNGGWTKNVDLVSTLSEVDRQLVLADKNRSDTTMDNNATWAQVVFLAKVYTEFSLPRHKQGFEDGVNFLLNAQYANGGWPQYYPEPYYSDPKLYSLGITHNDGVMSSVLRTLTDIAGRKGDYAFVDESLAARVRLAVNAGIANLLNTQVVFADGTLTAWAAQYDPVSLVPIWARGGEPPAVAALESVEVIAYLMSLPNPSRGIIDAIDAAIEWLDSVQISGFEWDQSAGTLYADPSAFPLWSRFYEIDTGRPIFGNNFSIVYNVNDLPDGTSYTWYHRLPAVLVADQPVPGTFEFHDDFERARTGGQTAASLLNQIGLFYTIDSGIWNISDASNAGRIPNQLSATQNGFMYFNAFETKRGGSSDYSYHFSADVWSGGYGTGHRQGLVFNYQDPGNFYAFDFFVTAAGQGSARLLQYVDGARTVLAQRLDSLNLDRYIYYRMEVVGNAAGIMASLKSTDGAITYLTAISNTTTFMSGYAGFWRSSPGSVSFDNFSLALDFNVDGVPLDWIKQHFGSTVDYIATNDDDLDGLSNREEYFAATNPTDSTSVLKIDNLVRSASESKLHYRNGGPESIVYIEWRRTLTEESDWSTVFTDVGPASATNVFTHWNTDPMGFYRLRAERVE
jgi:PelA/Pel-15E family pectate lyase